MSDCKHLKLFQRAGNWQFFRSGRSAQPLHVCCIRDARGDSWAGSHVLPASEWLLVSATFDTTVPRLLLLSFEQQSKAWCFWRQILSSNHRVETFTTTIEAFVLTLGVVNFTCGGEWSDLCLPLPNGECIVVVSLSLYGEEKMSCSFLFELRLRLFHTSHSWMTWLISLCILTRMRTES